MGSNLGAAGSNLGAAGSNLGAAGSNLGAVGSNLGAAGSNLGAAGSNLGAAGSNRGLFCSSTVMVMHVAKILDPEHCVINRPDFPSESDAQETNPCRDEHLQTASNFSNWGDPPGLLI